MDYPDVGSLAMPSALLVVHGQQDSSFPPDGVRAAINSLRQSYQAIGIGIHPMFRLSWLVRRDDHSAIDPLLQIYYIPALSLV
jgi:hypothetical protein